MTEQSRKKEDYKGVKYANKVGRIFLKILQVVQVSRMSIPCSLLDTSLD